MGLRSSEKGVFLPLVAVVALAVIAVIVGLGIDSSRVKRGSALLRQKLEAACHQAAQKPTLQAEAAMIFAGQITDTNMARALLDFGVTLDHISFINPTMPDDGSFVNFPGYSSANPTPAPALYELGSSSTDEDGIVEFSGLGLDSCIDSEGHNRNECSFQAKVSQSITHLGAGGSVTVKEFPARLWNQTQNVGNTVGCVAYGRVNTLLSGERPISAKVVWQKKLRGKWDEAYDAGSPVTTSPALSILIAPHMTTDDSPELNFGGYDATFRDSYDPINVYNVGASTPVPNAFLAAVATPPLYPGLAYQPIEPRPPALEYTYLRDTPPAVITAVRPAVFAQKEEALLACMNPAVLVRNSFVSTIVELASRNGQLRNQTQLLLSGTQHRTLQDNTNLDSLPYQPNNPVIMVDFGQDLMDSYQLPYVSYDAGVEGSDVPADFAPAQGGRLNPFTKADGTPLPFPSRYPTPLAAPLYKEVLQHQSVIAGQLRNCYHLYQGAAAPDEDPLARYKLKEIYENGKEAQAYFEPDEFDFDPVLLGQVDGYMKDQSYEQLCAWSASGCNVGYTKGLTGAEMVASLGTIQKCPFRDLIYPSSSANTSNLCDKPDRLATPPPAPATISPPQDLRADLLGAFYYLSQKDLRGSPDINNHTWGSQAPAAFKAAKSPGLFPFVTFSNDYDATKSMDSRFSDLRDHWYPFLESNYKSAENTKASVLLILHQRLSAGERDAIKDLLTDLNSFGFTRPLTVVYIPTTLRDNDARAIDDLRKAFHIPDKVSPDSNTDNALYVYGPSRGVCSLAGHPELDTFAGCWHHLLTSPDINIQKIAEQVYYDRLLKMDLIF